LLLLAPLLRLLAPLLLPRAPLLLLPAPLLLLRATALALAESWTVVALSSSWIARGLEGRQGASELLLLLLCFLANDSAAFDDGDDGDDDDSGLMIPFLAVPAGWPPSGVPVATTAFPCLRVLACVLACVLTLPGLGDASCLTGSVLYTLLNLRKSCLATACTSGGSDPEELFSAFSKLMNPLAFSAYRHIVVTSRRARIAWGHCTSQGPSCHPVNHMSSSEPRVTQ
jgi:hypothetical protein